MLFHIHIYIISSLRKFRREKSPPLPLGQPYAEGGSPYGEMKMSFIYDG